MISGDMSTRSSMYASVDLDDERSIVPKQPEPPTEPKGLEELEDRDEQDALNAPRRVLVCNGLHHK